MIGNLVHKKLKVLAVHRYYWPDSPPYASILRRIVSQWVEDGHAVDVLTSQPSYKKNVDVAKRPTKENIDGATVRRLSLPFETAKPLVRILNTAKISVALFWNAVIKRRYDVIMISTAPPVIGGFVAAAVAKITGARFIYHCMDIHPEIGRVSGEFRNPLVFKLLQNIDRWSCRQADPVIVLSEDMKRVLMEREPHNSPNVEVINNFSVPSEQREEPESLPFELDENHLNILFAGNIGRFQGLEALVSAFNHPRLKNNKEIQLTIMGEGNRKSSLESYIRDNEIKNVKFVGHHSIPIAKLAMRCADYGFVSLVPTLYQYAYPSKTVTYLEQGCPVLAAVEPESELVRDLVKTGAGIFISVSSPDDIASKLNSLLAEKKNGATRNKKALNFARENFAEQHLLPKWTKQLKRNTGVEK